MLTITGSDQADNIEVYKKDGMLYVREVVKNSILFSMPMPDPIVMQNAPALTTNPLNPTLQKIVVNANGGPTGSKSTNRSNVPVTMRAVPATTRSWAAAAPTPSTANGVPIKSSATV